ncbi:hypothetical protein [Vulcaniibacterium tengchongense]|nr:hypothetical protein [Vulcaniibacterium tengchongense]
MSHLLETKSVTSGEFRAGMDGGIYERYDDVPDAFRPRLERRRDGGKTEDYAGMLRRGKDWIVEPLKELQPYSYRAFQEVVGPLLLGIVLIKDLKNPDGPPLVTPVMFFDASGRMVQVRPAFAGGTYEDGRDTIRGTLQSLPAALARSWLWRTNGWRMPSEPFQGPLINRRLVCHPMQGWASIEDVLKTYDPKRWKWMMNTILKRFPDAVVTHYHPDDGSPSEWTQMRCFLDTRPPGVNGPVGDQFFVFDEHRDQTVYHIHRGDIDSIRILRDPADAIDRYCAHTLRRHPGEFDFSPWSEPL